MVEIHKAFDKAAEKIVIRDNDAKAAVMLLESKLRALQIRVGLDQQETSVSTK